MYFEVQHTGEGEQGGVEVGALGLSLPFDAFFDKRSLEQVAVQCSFSEAYVGGPLGYLTVTRANGAGPVLLVLPTEDSEMSFEAWRPLRHYDKTPCGFGFEGHHEVLVLSKAVAEQDWPEAQPWNPGTSRLLLPGQSLVVGLRFVLAAGPEQVEDALLAAGHPVALAVPGWLLHADQEDGRLVLKLPPGLALTALQPHPPDSIRLTQAGSSCPRFVGRVRLALHFDRRSPAPGPVPPPARQQVEQWVHLLALPPARVL
ncbi:uncharacterized protein HaLaN_19181, partial [Haematococcus lacustris]